MRQHPNPVDTRQASAAALAAAASLALLILPLYAEVEISAGGPGRAMYSTLLETVGPPVFLPILVPVVLTSLPFLARGRARPIVAGSDQVNHEIG